MENRTYDDDYYYDIIRANIRRVRIRQGLTQQELADRVGLSRDYVCDIENPRKHKYFTIAVLGRITETLGVDIEEMFRQWFK